MKPHIITVLVTLLLSIIAYFKLTPDPGVAADIADAAHKAADALAARNWVMGFNSLIIVGSIIYDYVTGRKAAG